MPSTATRLRGLGSFGGNRCFAHRKEPRSSTMRNTAAVSRARKPFAIICNPRATRGRIEARNFAHHQGVRTMAERRRKFWGWGYEDQGPTPEQQKHMAERMAKRFDLPRIDPHAAAERERAEPARAARAASRCAQGNLLDLARTIAPGTAMAKARAISSARFAATIRIPSTWWRFRAMRRTSSASSNGATARRSPRRLMAEAPASSVASKLRVEVTIAAPCRSI